MEAKLACYMAANVSVRRVVVFDAIEYSCRSTAAGSSRRTHHNGSLVNVNRAAKQFFSHQPYGGEVFYKLVRALKPTSFRQLWRRQEGEEGGSGLT